MLTLWLIVVAIVGVAGEATPADVVHPNVAETAGCELTKYHEAESGYNMACLKPMTLPSRKEGELTTLKMVPCGKCGGCFQDRRNEWTFRVSQEMKTARTAYFITLTYAPEFLPQKPIKLKIGKHNPIVKQGVLIKSHMSDYLKAVRQLQTREIPELNHTDEWKIRFYGVGEYGPTGTRRPHMHIIVFNIHPDLVKKGTINRAWTKGFTTVEPVTPGRIHYVTNYFILKHINDQITEQLPEPFTNMSRNPGIGANYLTNEKVRFHKNAKANYVVKDGHKMRMPRYYRDKIFDDTEKAEQQKAGTERMNKTIVKQWETLNDRGHPNPSQYMADQISQKHDLIMKRSTKNRKL